jgi:Protein of unknown function (DUF3306)
MSNPESFLTRWSRRKHAALEGEEIISSEAPSPAPLEEAAGKTRTSGTEYLVDDSGILPSTGLNTAAPPFDPLSVPPIESITADTDIRGFLAPGVPPDLTRAALRRAWAADPKIRDFVGLADYDWDFNAPGSMAGFGPLEMTEELLRMAAQIVGPPPTQDQAAAMHEPASANMTSDQVPVEPDLAQARPVGLEIDHGELAQYAPIVEPMASCKAGDLGYRDQETGAPLPQSRKLETSRLIVRQNHGAALPK